MKFIYTILIILLFTNAYGKDDTHHHLVAINTCWTEQNDYPALPVNTNISEDKDWIQLHLSLVEQTLRSRSINNLNANQKANRLGALDYLHDYWQQGNFPINDKYAERTPIFIDDHNNFCAVGYLIKATGHEEISRMIASKTNLAYVREMHYAELNAWAKEYGFTVDELAWIQPTYGPMPGRNTSSIARGTNGIVTELFVDGSGEKLYVGGTFSKVDSIIDAQNIAYVTESNGVYQWHPLGSGINGTVYAICEYQGKIFAGGSFTMAGGNPISNVAYWNGTSWHDAGCIFGTVKDLIVHNNELFAVGDFDICAALSEVNAAKWNNANNMWAQMPLLEGHVNTIESYNGSLILGGQFVWNFDTVNIIKWSNSTGYEPYLNTIKNEVMDIGLFKDTLYAVCKRTSTDPVLVKKLIANSWTGHPVTYDNLLIPSNQEEYNTFCVNGDTAMVGGYFTYQGMVFPSFSNCIDIEWMNDGHDGNWFIVDSTINKMVVYKNELIFGGAFKVGYNYLSGIPDKSLNGIGKIYRYKPTGINTPNAQNLNLKIYPNPIKTNGVLKFLNNMNTDNMKIISIDGRSIGTFRLSAKQSEIRLPDLASGTYMLLFTDGEGMKVAQKLIVD